MLSGFLKLAKAFAFFQQGEDARLLYRVQVLNLAL